MKDLNSAFTIDNYYDVNFYNQTKMALVNNDIDFMEVISVKQPNLWFLSTSQLPIAINYDLVSTSELKFLVTKVKPLSFNDEYKLYRKGQAKSGDVLQFIENDALRKARTSKYACFFNVKSKQDLKTISESYPGKIFFLGKYFSNKLRVCLACHEAIKGVIDYENILLEKGNLNGAGMFEAEFNFKVMKNRDRLIKFSETPYMEDGKYHNVKIQSDRASSSKYILS